MNIIQDLKRLLSIPSTPETFKRKVSEIVAKYDNEAEVAQEQAEPAETEVIEEAVVVEQAEPAEEAVEEDYQARYNEASQAL